MAALEQYFSQQRIATARERALASIGKDITIRIDKSNTVVGVVDACEPSYASVKGRTAVLVYKVDVLCGSSKVRRTYNLTTLPA